MPEWTKPYYGCSYYGAYEDRRWGAITDYSNFVTINLYERRKSRYSDAIVLQCVEHETVVYKEFFMEHRETEAVAVAKRYVEKFVNGE